MPSTLRTLALLVTLSLLAPLFTACASTPSESSEGAAPSPVGPWLVTEIGGTGMIPGVEVTLDLGEDGGLSGSTGVNRLRATFERTGSGLTLSPVMTTRMAGRPELMEQEQRLLRSLEGVRGYSIEGGQLRLQDGEGAALVVARRR